MSHLIAYIANDQVLEVAGLKNGISDAFIAAGSVWATMVDLSSAQVTGQTWPLTLTDNGSGTGTYRGTLQNSLALSNGTQYTLIVEADAGSDLYSRWDLEVRAQWRKS